MAYGNYAPFYRSNYFNGFQPQIGQPMMNQPAQEYIPQYQQHNEMIWVLNEAEATAYPVAPNNSVVLWDKSDPIIYVKSVNAQGVPSMRILDFTERNSVSKQENNTHNCTCGDKFVLKEDFESLKTDFENFKATLSNADKKTAKKSKEGEE